MKPYIPLPHPAPITPPLSGDTLLTLASLLLCHQEYTSEFQAKYQKLLVRDLRDSGGRPLGRGPSLGWPKEAGGEEFWAELSPPTLPRPAPSSGSRI